MSNNPSGVCLLQIVELIAARQAARQSLPACDAVPERAAGATSPTLDTAVDEVTVMAMAAELALRELDAAIARSMELAESSDDPTSAQVQAYGMPAELCRP